MAARGSHLSPTPACSRAAASVRDFTAGTLIAVTEGKLLMGNNKWGGTLVLLLNAGDSAGQDGCAEGLLAFTVVTYTFLVSMKETPSGCFG